MALEVCGSIGVVLQVWFCRCGSRGVWFYRCVLHVCSTGVVLQVCSTGVRFYRCGSTGVWFYRCVGLQVCGSIGVVLQVCGSKGAVLQVWQPSSDRSTHRALIPAAVNWLPEP